MDIIPFSDGKTWVHRLEPRARLLGATSLTVVLSQQHERDVLFCAVVFGMVTVVMARVPLAALLQRLIPLNVFLLGVLATIPFLTPGEPVFRIATVVATREGLLHGTMIFLKSNAIVMFLTAFIGSIEFVALGRALSQLGVPEKLVNILLFTVRYINLMLAEYERLSRAAVLRGFQPGANLHTLRTTGFLVGMVLVRSYDRGARMLDAMKLRGYDGTLTWVDTTKFCARDYVFLGGIAVSIGMLLGRGLV